MSPRVLRALFVAYVAATVAHLGFVVRHEPFAFDAWNVALDTRAAPITAGRFLAYVGGQYAHSNPRIGQPLTYLAYKLEWFAVVATPLVWLALALAIVVIGLGRWPRWRRGGDLALYAAVLGAMWFGLPQIGKTLFCRAYCANYVYGACLQLWLVAALRLARPPRAGWTACAGIALLGLAAGMANEHTGPTLVAGALGYAALRQRRDPRPPTLAWAAAAGATLGFLAIFFAPGQGQRYDGLATKATLLGRLLQRGIVNNLDILRGFLTAAMPALLMLVAALVVEALDDRPAGPADPSARAARRRALGLVGLALLAGTAIAATVFVSPKLGTRFYLCGGALLLAGFVAVADAVLAPRRLAPFVVLAVLASGYAAARTVPLYARLARASAARLAALEAAPRGAVFVADAWEQVDDGWWFLGDDLRDPKKRDLIARYFDLGGVIFRGVDLDAPLGVSDVRLAPRYALDPPGCLDEHGGFALGAYRGLDVASIHQAARAAIAALEARLAPTHLARLDLEVEFTGPRPALPRPRLLVARWRPDGLEAYAAAIGRRGIATRRDVALPPALRARDLEVYAYRVGGEARLLGRSGAPGLGYAPWGAGAYWVLACEADACFVVAATRHAA